MKKNYLKTFLVCFGLLLATNTYINAQNLITIAQARLQPVTTKVKVRGIVTVTPGAGTNYRQRSIQDGTCENCGMTIFNATSPELTDLTIGDSVEVSGELGLFREALQIVGIPSAGATTPFVVTTISRGNPIPRPIVLTTAQLNVAAAKKYESMLVRVEDVVFANNTRTVFSGATSYYFNDSTNPLSFSIGGANPALPSLRVNVGNSMAGQDIPTGTFSFKGILVQSKAPTTVGEGYQIIPNGIGDFEVGFSLSNFKQTAVTSTALNIGWNTNIDAKNTIKIGLAPVDIDATVYGTPIVQTNFSKSGSIALTNLLPATLYTVEITSQTVTGKTIVVRDVFVTASESTGEIKVFFNASTATALPTMAVPVGNPVVCGGTSIVAPQNLSTGFNNLPNTDEVIASYIDKARFSIEIAVYNSNSAGSPRIIAALNAAGARGVQVRYIYDASTANTALVTGLPTTANVKKMADRPIATPIPPRTNNAIMHNKFIVADANSSNANDPIVLTGSTNWTSSMLNTDANSLIIVQDQALARNYKLEFDEMWGDTVQGGATNAAKAKYGQYKTDNTAHEFKINGKRVESYFSPSDATNARLVSTVNTTNSELYAAIFSFTKTDVANAIKNVKFNHPGAVEYAIYDDSVGSSASWNIVKPALGANAIKDNATGIFHHKYLIVDANDAANDPLLWVGSHNWSSAADTKNDENTLVVHDANVANQYYQEYIKRLKDNGVTPILTSINNGVGAKLLAVMYPNPTTDVINIQLLNSQPAVINIYTTTGALIYRSTTSASTNINVSAWVKGMYVVHLIQGNTTTNSKLIVE